MTNQLGHINNRCDFIHKYDILVPKKVHSEMIFAMHRILLIIRQKDLSHLVHQVHIFYSSLDFIEEKEKYLIQIVLNFLKQFYLKSDVSKLMKKAEEIQLKNLSSSAKTDLLLMKDQIQTFQKGMKYKG